jgi:hypothetical protein
LTAAWLRHPVYPCPHCARPSISPLAKWWSGNVRPARCPGCGGWSHVRSTTARQCGAAALVVLAAGVLGFVWHPHLAWLVGGWVAALCIYLLCWHLCALEPADGPDWKPGRNGWLSLFALAILLVWWLGRNA